MQQEEEGKTVALVSEYLRCVPAHYRKGPEVITIELDKNNEAELVIRNKPVIIRVVESEPASAPQTILQRLHLKK